MAVIAPDKEDIRTQEETAAPTITDPTIREDKPGDYPPNFKYSGGDKNENGRIGSRIGATYKKHKRRVWLLGGIGGGILFGIALVMFMLGSFLIPHFFANMVGYRFAGEARSFRQANSQILSRSLADDSMSDEEYKQTQSKFSSLAKWATMQKYRPAAIMRELQRTGSLNFQYEPLTAKNLLRPRKVSAIILNGETIPISNRSKWGIPFSRASNNIKLSAAVDDALFKGWHGTSGSLGAVLRTSVGSKILQEAGVTGFYAWANKAKDYKGLDAEESDIQDLRRRYARESNIQPTSSAIKKIDDGAKQADDELNKAVADQNGAKQIINNPDQLPKTVTAAITQASGTGIVDKAISATSTAAAIGIPLCMIFDGSLESSGSTIDARAAALQQQFIGFGEAAHQQEAGAVAAEAIGAFNRTYNRDGGIARSDLQKTLSGEQVDTRDSVSPQASMTGEYSLANVVFNNDIGNKINQYAIPTCQVVSSAWFGLLTGGIELGIGFFTGESSKGVTEVFSQAGAKALGTYIADFGRSLFTKKFAKKFVAQGGAIAGATFLARLLVSDHANLDYKPIAAGEKAANNADAGAAINAAETNRALMGRPLTDEEAIASKQADTKFNAEQQQQLGFVDRYFSLQNSSSLVSKMGDSLVTNFNLSSLSNLFTHLGSLFNPAALLGTFGKLAPSASAASTIDTTSYGVVSMGFSTAETNAIDTQETYYDIFTNDKVLDDSGKKQEISDKYSTCFNDSMGTLLSKGLIQRTKQGGVVEDDGDINHCTPKNLGMANPQYGDLVFRWRVSLRADKTIASGEEVAEPTTATTTSLATTSSGRISGQGDVATLAQQVLARQGKTIKLSANALRDVQNATNVGTCGATSLHPAILQLLLALTDPNAPTYYTLGINNFVTGHDCNGGQHPLGRAMDIESINGTIVRVNSSAQNPGEEIAFIKYVASLMPEGTGGIGQKECSVVGNLDLSPAEFFVDNGLCNHFHVDVRKVP
ncbi:MAG TPA: hypothetical protein VMR45_03270 [Patescibacteria group bacterium]|nr:hypothetical protein [Patescibacteria group bacterium]